MVAGHGGKHDHGEEGSVRKGAWTVDEDRKLVAFIRENKGHGSWRTLPKLAGLQRCGKSCRLRWTNYLRPGIKRGNISPLEERLIVLLHAQLGNKWSTIATYLAGRTDNEVKNHWNTHLKKRIAQQRFNTAADLPSTFFPLQRRSCANLLPLLSGAQWQKPPLQQSLQFNSIVAFLLQQSALVRLEAEATHHPATSHQSYVQNYCSIRLPSPNHNQISAACPASNALQPPDSMSSDHLFQEVDLPTYLLNFDVAVDPPTTQTIGLDTDGSSLVNKAVDDVGSHDSYWSNLLKLVNQKTHKNLGVSNDENRFLEC